MAENKITKLKILIDKHFENIDNFGKPINKIDNKIKDIENYFNNFLAKKILLKTTDIKWINTIRETIEKIKENTNGINIIDYKEIDSYIFSIINGYSLNNFQKNNKNKNINFIINNLKKKLFELHKLLITENSILNNNIKVIEQLHNKIVFTNKISNIDIFLKFFKNYNMSDKKSLIPHIEQIIIDIDNKIKDIGIDKDKKTIFEDIKKYFIEIKNYFL